MNPTERRDNPPDAAAADAPWMSFALASLSLSMLLASLGTSIANIALPTLAQVFDASFSDVQWVVLAYLLTITSLIVAGGKLGDVVGRRRLLLAGFVLFTVASALCGAAPTLGMLIAARAAQGAGAAVMMALTMAMVGDTVSKEKTGSAMGLLGTMSAAGTLLGPSVGGILIAEFGWRTIFFINVPLGVIAFVLAYRYLPADRPSKTDARGFDVIGTVLLALALTAYALSMTIGRGQFGPINAGLLATAVLVIVLFVRAERRATSPMIQLALFRGPVLSASLAISALVSTVMMATLVVGPFYLSVSLGLTPALVGLVVAVGPAVVVLTGVPAGRMTDYAGTQRMIVAGLIAIATGCVALSVTPATLGIAGYVAPLVLITAGYAMFQTANNTDVMTTVARDQRGAVSGMLNLSRNLGLITGASMMGAVFTLASGMSGATVTRAAATATGMRVTFAVGAALMMVALGIAFWRRIAGRRQSPYGQAQPQKAEVSAGRAP